MAEVLFLIRKDLDSLLPDIRFKYSGLPYLFASFKLHKLKYRWITSVEKCAFLGIASMIMWALKLIMFKLKIWCGEQAQKVFNLRRKRVSFFWVIDSLYKFIMNLPTYIHAIYMADITQCYERIPLEGPDNLHDALGFIIRKGFS